MYTQQTGSMSRKAPVMQRAVVSASTAGAGRPTKPESNESRKLPEFAGCWLSASNRSAEKMVWRLGKTCQTTAVAAASTT